MDVIFKKRVTGISLLLLAVSMACGMPFGIGFTPPTGEEIAQASTSTPQPTPTPLPTPTSTFTPTSTPEPTSTATRVVLPTNTPTAVTGASGASAALGGDSTAIAAATTTAEMATATAAAPPPPPVAGTAQILVNGDFEANWPDSQSVAFGWTSFSNNQGHQSWYKDTWFKVIYDGKQAQMIELVNDGGVGDRYAGIYQTVNVVPGAEYELIIHGLVRSDEGSEGLSGGGYALQYGLDHNGGTDWQAVTDWVSLPFPEHPREDPTAGNVYTYGAYTVKFRPTAKTLTLFIRGWKKWADLNEANFDVDGLSLRGTGTQATATPAPAPTEDAPTPTPTLPPQTPVPPTATPTLAPEMPPSGGELPGQTPSAALRWLAVLSMLVLVAGAVVGLVKRRA